MLFSLYILFVTLLGLCSGDSFSTCGIHFPFTEYGYYIGNYSLEQTTTVDIIQNIGPLQCEKQCMFYTHCKSTFYSREQTTCVLLTTMFAGNRTIGHVSQFNLGPCDGNVCGVFERCIPLRNGTAVCVLSAKEGDIRLVNGLSEKEGRVEIYHDKHWGTIHANNYWSTTEAKTVCLQLGYSYGVPVPKAFFGEGRGPIWYDDVRCDGDITLATCTRTLLPIDNSLSHANDVGVICSHDVFNGEKAPIRLTGGATALAGRVEIFYAGHWGTVCGIAKNLYYANTVCIQLGYRYGTLIYMYLLTASNDLTWRHHPSCLFYHKFLTDCGFRTDWGDVPCDKNYRLAAICLEDKNGTVENVTNLPVRLMNGATLFEGRVEVFYAGYWGTVCLDFWNHEDARVICRQLNFTGGVAVSYTVFGNANLDHPVWLSDVECVGDEDNIAQCQYPILGQYSGYCHNNIRDAGVICSDPQKEDLPPQDSIRLVNGNNSTEGRVEVYVHGYWTAACKIGWDGRDALVACRQLGYNGGLAIRDGRYGSGTGYSILGALQCIGLETQLLHCDYDFATKCPLFMEAGVICFQNVSNQGVRGDTIRLTGVSSDNRTYGRLEVYYAGHWGTVCDNYLWTESTASVVCKQLGLSGGRFFHRAFFGKGTDPIWMDDVKCNGTETTLAECSFDTAGECSLEKNQHDLDVSVVCDDPNNSGAPEPYGNVRLVNGSSTAQGVVEIYGRTGYATVCTRADHQASVSTIVCKQLGYDPSLAKVLDEDVVEMSVAWVFDVRCTGYEQRLDQCKLSSDWTFSKTCRYLTYYFKVACFNSIAP